MAEKLIVTLWRGEIRNFNEQLYGVYCILRMAKEQRRSKTVYDIKLLPWKETFVFTLPALPEAELKLEFINLHEGEQIHFSQDHIADSICFAKAATIIPIEKHNIKGTVPRKTDIVDEQGTAIGKVFLQYQLLKTEVKYMVEKPIEYNYMLCLSQIKVSLVRNLKDEPIFFLQAAYGDQVKKEEFSMTNSNGDYFYNYPIKYYIKNEQIIKFELISKTGLTTHIAPIPPPSKSQNVKKVTNGTIISQDTEAIGKTIKKKLSLDTITLFSIFDLIYTQDAVTQEKIPIYASPNKEVGYIQFHAEVIFKTKEELKEQNKQERAAREGYPSKKRHQNVVAHNGSIIINSMIVRLQPFNEELIKNKDFSVEIKIGRQIVESSTLQNPGRQLIFIDNFRFKRIWQEKLQFSIIKKDLTIDPPEQVPIFFTETNLRELFDSGRFLAKRLVLVDEDHNYCGQLILDVSYAQEQKKKQISSPTKEIKQDKSYIEIKEEQKQIKINKIKDRMKQREETKRQRSIDLSQNNHSLVLPPISERDLPTLIPRSPHRKRGAASISDNYNMSQQYTRRLGLGDPKRNIFNKGQDIKFSKSPRFKQQKPILHNDPFFYRRESDFQQRNKGPSIGYGLKVDSTKDTKLLPGVGRYQIPSLWDKYG